MTASGLMHKYPGSLTLLLRTPQASDDAARIAALTSQLQTMAADQARTAGDVTLLKQKYVQKSAALKEVSMRV